MQPSRIELLCGMLCIIGVIHCWVGSSELIQNMYNHFGYAKPLVVTFSAALVSCTNLLPFLWDAKWQWALQTSWKELKRNHGPWKASAKNLDALPEDEECNATETSPFIVPRDETEQDEQDCEQVLPHEIFGVAVMYALIYIPGSYSLNLSLCGLCGTGTSVASATVLSTAHSLWTLLLSIPLLNEYPCAVDYIAVVLCLGGAMLVTGMDGATAGESFVGDALGCSAAFFFGLQPVLLQKWNVTDFRMFFGFVALFQVTMMLPLMGILHWRGVETFMTPPMAVVGCLFAYGVVIVFANQLFGMAVRLTNPFVVNIGTSLCIPLAMLADLVNPFSTTTPHFTWQYLAGTGLILSSLVLICLGESKGAADDAGDDKEEESASCAEEADVRATAEAEIQTDAVSPSWARAVLRSSWFIRTNSSFVPSNSFQPSPVIMRIRRELSDEHAARSIAELRRHRTAPLPGTRRQAKTEDISRLRTF